MPTKRFSSRLDQTIATTALILLLTAAGLLAGLASPALAGVCDVTLAWDSSTGAAGYRLFMRQEGQSYTSGSPAWQGGTRQCTLSSLNENTTYYFVVRAFDAAGKESGDSNEVRFFMDANAPATPVILSPAAGSQNVALTPELMTGPFHDPDRNEYHARTQWQVFRSADDLPVFKLASDFYLTNITLPPLILDETTSYAWSVRHLNQNKGSSASASGDFSTALWAADGDADGVPDAQEVNVPLDLDNNGQDDGSQSKMKCLRSVRGGVNVAVDAAQSPSIVDLSAVQAVNQNSLETPYSGALQLPIGLIGFKALAVNTGDAAEVTLRFSTPIPPECEWILFSLSEGYEDYSHSSAIAADRRSVVVQVQDGGNGDLDGVANGTIVHMGAYGSLPPGSNLDGSDSGASSGGGGGGGGGCFINSLKVF